MIQLDELRVILNAEANGRRLIATKISFLKEGSEHVSLRYETKKI